MEGCNDVSASPVLIRYFGGLLASSPIGAGMNPSGRSSSMWLESEQLPYHKYTSSFAWTGKPATRFPGGYTHICISFSSASTPTVKNTSVLTSVHVCLPLETVLMSCHSGFLWPPGCWRTAGLWLGAERTRHACCCLATTQRCLALCAGAAVRIRKVRITKQ